MYVCIYIYNLHHLFTPTPSPGPHHPSAQEHPGRSHGARGEGRGLAGQLGPFPAHRARIGQRAGERRRGVGGEGGPPGRRGQCGAPRGWCWDAENTIGKP